jgi:hypothetical protein
MFGTLQAVWAEMGQGKFFSEEKKRGGGVLALITSAIQQMPRV